MKIDARQPFKPPKKLLTDLEAGKKQFFMTTDEMIKTFSITKRGAQKYNLITPRKMYFYKGMLHLSQLSTYESMSRYQADQYKKAPNRGSLILFYRSPSFCPEIEKLSPEVISKAKFLMNEIEARKRALAKLLTS